MSASGELRSGRMGAGIRAYMLWNLLQISWPAPRAAGGIRGPNMKTESHALSGAWACSNRPGDTHEPGGAAGIGTCIIVRTIAWAAEGSSTLFYSNPFSDRYTCMLDSVPRKIRQVLAVDLECPNPPARVRANPARFSCMMGTARRMDASRTVRRGASPARITHPAGAPSGAAGRGEPPSSRRCRLWTQLSLCGPACPCRHTSC